MSGKVQEPGLTEIGPLICISATWDQHPVCFHILSSPGFTVGVAAAWRLLDHANILSLLEEFTFGGPQPLMTLTSLFTDMAGDTPVPPRGPQGSSQP